MAIKCRFASSCRRLASILLAVVAAGVGAQAATAGNPVVDQEQATINVSAGVFPIGLFEQALAQSVTAGVSGRLTEVRLPVFCGATGELTVRIEGWAGSRPDGNVLASETFPGASLPFFPSFPADVALRSFPLSTPPMILAGHQFAVVAAGTGCAIFPGPVGDPYPGGNGYYMDVSNPWSCLCGFPNFGYGSDLPFATLVEHVDTSPPVISTPAAVTANADGADGAVVGYSASAVDDTDGAVAVSCVPPSGSTFPIGTTTVTCTATDTSGNSASGSFDVRVLGAAEQLDDLIALVDDYGLGKLGSSLHDKLVTASRFLAAGKPRQAEDNVESFVAQVAAQRAKGLTDGQADALRDAAQRILAVIET